VLERFGIMVATLVQKLFLPYLHPHATIPCQYVCMPKRSSTNINLIAARIARETVGIELEGKNPAAVALGRKGGLKGGKARAAVLTAEQRKYIATKAAQSRWAKKEEEL
jgi:hypothetical protein